MPRRTSVGGDDSEASFACSTTGAGALQLVFWLGRLSQKVVTWRPAARGDSHSSEEKDPGSGTCGGSILGVCERTREETHLDPQLVVELKGG